MRRGHKPTNATAVSAIHLGTRITTLARVPVVDLEFLYRDRKGEEHWETQTFSLKSLKVASRGADFRNCEFSIKDLLRTLEDMEENLMAEKRAP